MATIPNTRLIPLTQGKFAIVDEADFESLAQWSWHFLPEINGHCIGYARRNYKIVNGIKYKQIFMHKVLMNESTGPQIDHINGNGLDNRRENLRYCSQSQNMGNSRKNKYKGVSYDSFNKKWRAIIGYNNKLIHLGRFINKSDAAKAYNIAAIKHFGEFAYLNTIEEAPEECSNPPLD